MSFLLWATYTALVGVPCLGLTVRMDAHYMPRAVKLDSLESGAPTETLSEVNSSLSLARRTYRMEGIRGIFRGFWPILTLVAMIYYGTTLMLNILDVQQSPVPALPRIITLAATDMRIFSTWAACVLFLSIPYLVLIARCVTVPEILPWFGPLKPIPNILLTSYEQNNPWCFYQSLGLLSSLYTQLAIALSVTWAQVVYFRGYPLPETIEFSDLTTLLMRTLVVGGISCLTTILLAPLILASVRFLVQRNHGPGGEGIEMDVDVRNTVINLQWLNLEPYTGLFDLLKRVHREEGLKSLFRL